MENSLDSYFGEEIFDHDDFFCDWAPDECTERLLSSCSNECREEVTSGKILAHHSAAERCDSLDSVDSELSRKPKRAKSKHHKEPSCVPAIPPSTKKLMSIMQKIRNEPEMKLYAYVTYDKHDSLVYFPTKLARHFTSANIHAYAKLLSRNCHRHHKTTYEEQLAVRRPASSCPILLTITKALDFSREESVRMLEVTSELHPDCVCHVLSTQVIENQIIADMTYSYTDAPGLYSGVTNTDGYSYLRIPQAGQRAGLLWKQLHLSVYPLHLQQQLMAAFSSPDELVFTMRLKVVFTFNHSDKIVSIVRTNVQNTVTHKNTTYAL